MKRNVVLLVVIMLLATLLMAQTSEFGKKLENYEELEVFIGVVTQILQPGMNSNNYVLESDKGETVQVHTFLPDPIKGERYEVHGILYKYQSSPFISERKRIIQIKDEKNYQSITILPDYRVAENFEFIQNLVADANTYSNYLVNIQRANVESIDQNHRWYTLKGVNNGIIRVHSVYNLPKSHTNVENIKGYLYFNENGDAYISQIDVNQVELQNDKQPIWVDDTGNGNKLLYIVFGLVALLVILVIVYFLLKNKQDNYSGYYSNNENYSRTGSKKDDVTKTIILDDPDDEISKTIIMTAKTNIILGSLEIISEAPDKGKNYPIAGSNGSKGNTASIGRSKKCDIVIADMEEYRTISGEHGLFIQENGEIKYKNIKNSNSSFVNGEIVKEASVLLNDGDKLRLGSLIFLFKKV